MSPLFPRTTQKVLEFNIGIVGKEEDERAIRKSFRITDKQRIGVLRIGTGRNSDLLLKNKEVSSDQGYIEIFFMGEKVKLTYTNLGEIPAQILFNGNLVKILGKKESFDIDKRYEIVFGSSKIYMLYRLK